jgi:hypothetical protein
MLPSSTTFVFSASKANISYLGLRITDPGDCIDWLSTAVRARAYDAEEAESFETLLHAEGFDTSQLFAAITAPDEPLTEKDLGESMAELALQQLHHAVWFTNRRRDMRSVRASLPGADIVGFVPCEDGGHRLIFAEVKTSSDPKVPPAVMYGETGLQYQLYKLATDARILKQLLRYTFARVRGTEMMPVLREALVRLDKEFMSGAQLVGVLVRDTPVAEKDASHHAGLLAAQLPASNNMSLIALYVCVPAKDWSLHCPPV